MPEKQKIVFIESNTTGTGELLIHKAISKGLKPIIVIKDPEKYSFLPISHSEIIILDTHNGEILLEYLLQLNNLIGIYSSSENYIEIASWLANKLNLPGSPYNIVKLFRNKYLLYQALASLKINVPETRKVSNFNESEAILNACIFPVIIKPNYGTGSSGVKLCKTKIESIKHIDFLFQFSYSEILIQEYIDSNEYSVEVCSIAGRHQVIGITKKYICNPPFFIETGHDFPAILSLENEIKIVDTITKLLSVLGYDFGFTHIELKLSNDNVTIIEVNPRLAGGMIPFLIEKSTNIDLLDYLIDLYVNNQNKSLEIKYNQFSSIRYFIPQNSGRIMALDFEETLEVDHYKFLVRKGDLYIPQNNFKDRIAYLIVSDIQMNQCKEKANRLLKNFNIYIKNEG